MFVAFFQSGPGSIPWFISAELFDENNRSRAMAIAASFRAQYYFFYSEKKFCDVMVILTLTGPIGLPPHTPVAQNIAHLRLVLANSGK